MNKRRILAMILISAGIVLGDLAATFPPAQLEARNTTVTTIGIVADTKVGCTCTPKQPTTGSGGTRGGGSGGGTIHVAS